jgi:hypothetical protein
MAFLLPEQRTPIARSSLKPVPKICPNIDGAAILGLNRRVWHHGVPRYREVLDNRSVGTNEHAAACALVPAQFSEDDVLRRLGKGDDRVQKSTSLQPHVWFLTHDSRAKCLRMGSPTPGRSTTLERRWSWPWHQGSREWLEQGARAPRRAEPCGTSVWGAVLGAGQRAWAGVRASWLLGQKRRAQSAT